MRCVKDTSNTRIAESASTYATLVSLLNTKQSKAATAVHRKDAENRKQPCNIKISADLQKVIMLPRIDEFKACFFTQRLIFSMRLEVILANMDGIQLYCGMRLSLEEKTRTSPLLFINLLRVCVT